MVPVNPVSSGLVRHHELHDVRDQRSGQLVVAQHDLGPRLEVAEVDDHVETLGRCHDLDGVERDGPAHQTEVRPDEGERDHVVRVVQILQPQAVLPRLGAVQQPEAVLALLDVQEGPDLAVDDDAVPLEGILDGRGIEERAVGIELAVLDDDRDLELAARQAEGGLEVVAQQVEAGHARVDVETGDPECVVVVPERRRVLVVGILVDVGLPRQDGQLGLTVEARRQVSAVQVGGDARGVRVVVGSVRTLVHVEQVG
jgi:hypothetical protein